VHLLVLSGLQGERLKSVTVFWLILGIFAGSVLVARWQFSRTRAILQFLWYRHWRMRERQRVWETELYRRYPRFMHWQFRAKMPYYRLRNSERWWAIKHRVGSLWFRYARLWAPSCKTCGATLLYGGTCLSCITQEMVRKERIKMLAGRGDMKAVQGAEFMARLLGGPPKS